MKLNADVLLVTEGWVGMGVVARDEKGEIIFATTRQFVLGGPWKLQSVKHSPLDYKAC